MSKFRTCPECGAALDPGERCDCEKPPCGQECTDRHENCHATCERGKQREAENAARREQIKQRRAEQYGRRAYIPEGTYFRKSAYWYKAKK